MKYVCQWSSKLVAKLIPPELPKVESPHVTTSWFSCGKGVDTEPCHRYNSMSGLMGCTSLILDAPQTRKLIRSH